MKEFFGYTEPFRRFVQNETFSPQANEIPNHAASWLPGDDYYTNFHEGDPFIKVPEGYARLPGAGYEALHPELKGMDPEDYPDIHKMAILADVAPYSREYNTRDFRPVPCLGTIEKHSRLCREILRYLHIYELLALLILQPWLPAFTGFAHRLRSGPALHLQNCAT